MQREFIFVTEYPLWAFAAAAAVLLVAIVAIYRHERREIGQRRGSVLTLLRVALVALVLLMFGQPILRTWRADPPLAADAMPRIAVLVDDSRSMRIADGQAEPAERLRWADAVGLLPATVRPIRPELLASQLSIASQLADRLARQATEIQVYRARQVSPGSSLSESAAVTATMVKAAVERLGSDAKPLDEPAKIRPRVPPAALTQFTRLLGAVSSDALPEAKKLVDQLAHADSEGFEGKLDEKTLMDLATQAARASRKLRVAADLLDEKLPGVSGAAASTGTSGRPSAPALPSALPATLSWQIDSAVAARLDADGRAALEQVARMDRYQLARRLLADSGGRFLADLAMPASGASGAAGKDNHYAVNVYRFGATCERLSPEKIAEAAASVRVGGAASGSPATRPDAGGEYATDLANAVNTVLAQEGDSAGDVGGPGGRKSNLVALVVMSDDRFNGPGDVRQGGSVPGAAGLLRERSIPVVPVMIGSVVPPVHLAVTRVQAPDSMFKDDSATVTAVVAMDGLAGQDVEVELLAAPSGPNGQPGPTKPIDSRRLRVALASQRTQVSFTFKPQRADATDYLIRARLVGPNPPALAETGSASLPFYVNITEDRTNVLVVDGPPRWEFEYLANLLKRDKGTRVQQLLFAPAWIQPPTPTIEPAPLGVQAAPAVPPPPAGGIRFIHYASVKEATDKGVTEVTALPKTLGELFAFDVVSLGDVSPADLPVEQQKNLSRFVSERGGTLIVIAGKDSMPERFADQPIAGLLPVKCAQQIDSLTTAASLTPYRVKLTDDGLRSDILRLAAEPADSQTVWDRLPPCTWRCASVTAKPGATVLAYAEPIPGTVPFSSSSEKGTVPLVPDAQRGGQSPIPQKAAEMGTVPGDGAKPAEIARSRPLIVTQQYGVGRVIFLAFDRTWQLRYKAGDSYHHKLWGQVMRWASAGRLVGKSPFMKIGLEQTSFRPGDPISIRARVTDENFAPVTNAELSAVIKSGDNVIRQVNLLPAWTAAAEGSQNSPSGTPPLAASQPDAAASIGPGVYVARTQSLPPGNYQVVLAPTKVPGLTDAQRAEPAVTSLLVMDKDSVEMTDLAARPATELADLLFSSSTANRANGLYPPPTARTNRSAEDLVLWSSWWLLAVFAAVASAEWILRKRFGLI